MLGMTTINRREFLFGRRFCDDESGATVIEYGIVTAGIGFAGFTILQYVGQDTKTLYRCIKDAVAQKSPDGKCSQSAGAMAGGKGR